MAQAETILIDVDLSRARRHLKAVIREAQHANRELAALEERLGTLGARLAPYRIGLRIGDTQ